MSRKRHIFSFIIGLGCVCTMQAQQQTVIDDHGKTVEVMIPDADGALSGYVSVDYSDDKFYANGSSQRNNMNADAENGMEEIDCKIRNLSNVMSLTYND